jgi:hypothetical protein
MKLSTMIDNEFMIVLACVLNHVINCSYCNRKIWDSVNCELLTVNIVDVAYKVFKNVWVYDITIDKWSIYNKV